MASKLGGFVELELRTTDDDDDDEQVRSLMALVIVAALVVMVVLLLLFRSELLAGRVEHELSLASELDEVEVEAEAVVGAMLWLAAVANVSSPSQLLLVLVVVSPPQLLVVDWRLQLSLVSLYCCSTSTPLRVL